MGGRGVRACAGDGSAAPGLGRLQLVPLVPRHGARVVLRSGNSHVDERALREREGRPRGTARRRRADDGGLRDDDRSGRLADHRVPDAGRETVLRRHVLPPGPASRAAQLPAGPAGDRRGVGRPARRSRGAGRAARVRARRRNPARGGRGAALTVAPRDGRAWPRPRLRAGLRRLRDRAEVPARLRDRAPPAPRRRRGARDGATDARRDGRRRPVRRRRRRLPPLLGRRALGRSALREDALRQRAVDLRVPPCVGRDGRGPLSHGRGGDGRLPGARDAALRAAASPRRRTPTRTASRG